MGKSLDVAFPDRVCHLRHGYEVQGCSNVSHEDFVLRPCGERTNCARAAVCSRLEDLLDENKTILNDKACVHPCVQMHMEVEHFGNTATATQVSQLAVHALHLLYPTILTTRTSSHTCNVVFKP
jgi:hypothetical protein|mmetsp:Transcript_14984/g.39345  ORF Transcript_14984/g.39345 Transcript_14984/m.39345 type:complete len:124 (+) Transcript_14984:778-1149(+)